MTTPTLDVVVTYLEMTSPPTSPPPPRPAMQHAVMRANMMTVSFYRYLYNTVGGPHLWWERRILSDEKIAEIVHSDDVDISVLHVGGVPAGFYELSTDTGKNEVDLAYFGLLPDFVGMGFGGYFLRVALDDAWSREPERVTVNTCTLDHKNALPVYQRAGFVPCGQATRTIDDPRALGLFDT